MTDPRSALCAYIENWKKKHDVVSDVADSPVMQRFLGAICDLTWENGHVMDSDGTVWVRKGDRSFTGLTPAGALIELCIVAGSGEDELMLIARCGTLVCDSRTTLSWGSMDRLYHRDKWPSQLRTSKIGRPAQTTMLMQLMADMLASMMRLDDLESELADLA